MIYANNLRGSLAAALDAAASSMTVDPGLAERLASLLAAGDAVSLTLVGSDISGAESSWEIVTATAVVGAVVSIERGQDDTAAATWPLATRISGRLTAAQVNRVVRRAGRTLVVAGDYSLTAADDGATIVTAGPVRVPAGLPADFVASVISAGDRVLAAAGDGVELHCAAGRDPGPAGRWSRMELRAIAADQLVVTGDDLAARSEPALLICRAGAVSRLSAGALELVASGISDTQLSRNGALRADVAADQSLWIRPALGDESTGVQAATPVAFARYIWPGWSPDSAMLVHLFEDDGAWYIQAVDAAGAVIAQVVDESAGLPSWCGDLLISPLADGIRVHDASGAFAAADLLAGTQYSAVAGTAGAAALVRADGVLEIRAMPAGGALPAPVVSDALHAEWSPAGDRLAVLCSAEPTLRVYSTATGVWQQLAALSVPVPVASLRYMIWSPDGLTLTVTASAAPWVRSYDTMNWQALPLAPLPAAATAITSSRIEV